MESPNYAILDGLFGLQTCETLFVGRPFTHLQNLLKMNITIG